ncbi:MAG TPA: VTT domain-containing protein [Anaerolineae bacterium]
MNSADQVTSPAETARAPRLWQRLLGLALVIGISVAIVAFRKELAGVKAYGYPGLFLVNLIGNATLFLPAPVLMVVFAAGSTLVPPLVGLAAGSGAALGEMTGYIAGYGGSAVIEDQKRYAQMRRWMARWGIWLIFGLSLIPNPLFDLAGITAGALRVPVWRFFLACWAGKLIKMTAVAYMGGQALSVLEHFTGR